MNSPRPGIIEFVVNEPPEAWRAAGFAVDDDSSARVGASRLRFTGGEGGLAGWALRGLDGDGDLDGIPTTFGPDAGDPEPEPPGNHPNGVVRVDHVVVLSPDRTRTVEAFARLGLEPRRTREAGSESLGGGRPMLQTFFRLGEVIVELVTPAEADSSDRPAKLFGLAFEVQDLESLGQLLGPVLGPVRDAVQPGRRIATLRGRELGISVPVVFMSPES